MHNLYHNNVYNTTMSLYNLYSYMFRNFHIIVMECHICALLSYILKLRLLKLQFHKIITILFTRVYNKISSTL
jgi:hypothetical protein